MSFSFYPNYINDAGFSALVEPSITGETYECSGGETSGPAYDLVDSRRGTVVTLDTNAQTTSPIIDFDLSTDVTNLDFFILDNHNMGTDRTWLSFTRAGGTGLTELTCHSGTINEATSVIALDAGEFRFNNANQDGIALATITAATDNNWEINLGYDAAHQADLTFGEIFMGKKFVTSFQPEIGQVKSSYFGTGFSKSKGGQKYGFKQFGEARRWQLNWIYITDAERANFETLWQITEGTRFPFYIDMGENATPTLYFVRFAMEELQFTEIHGAWKLSIIVEEEI